MMHLCAQASIIIKIITIIKKEETKLTLKTIKPLQGHFKKVIKSN